MEGRGETTVRCGQTQGGTSCLGGSSLLGRLRKNRGASDEGILFLRNAQTHLKQRVAARGLFPDSGKSSLPGWVHSTGGAGPRRSQE